MFEGDVSGGQLDVAANGIGGPHGKRERRRIGGNEDIVREAAQIAKDLAFVGTGCVFESGPGQLKHVRPEGHAGDVKAPVAVRQHRLARSAIDLHEGARQGLTAGSIHDYAMHAGGRAEHCIRVRRGGLVILRGHRNGLHCQCRSQKSRPAG